MKDKKDELRDYYIAARRAMSAAYAERLSARIATNIFSLPGLLESDLIMIYHTAGSEVDTTVLIDMIINSGRGVVFPYIRDDEAIGVARVFSPRSADLAPGTLGIMEPVGRLRDNVAPEQLGAVVCPGVAFDEELGRLGRGGGHYDRFLRQIKGKALLIGCAFDCQISKEPLPREEHDITMDVVVTESRVLPHGACGESAAG